MTPETVVGLLAEPVRLRVFSAVALGAKTLPEVVRTAGTSAKETAVALRRLQGSGLVEETDGELGTRAEYFREITRGARSAERADQAEHHGYGDERVESLLRTFVRDGRLLRMPAQFERRRVVLRHLVQRSFEPGVRYTEKEVNEKLRAWYEGSVTDHVTLRRYLIDFCLLGREDGGAYWLREDIAPEQ